MSGFDVLAWIRQRPTFAAMKVVMLSGSAAASDTARAAELGANDYLVKPPNTAELQRVLQGI